MSMDDRTLLEQLEEARTNAARSERRAIMFGDIIAQHCIAMQAAVIAARQLGASHGMQWIINTLRGPGHLPPFDEAVNAQQWFDAKMAEHEAFRAAHPGPAAIGTGERER